MRKDIESRIKNLRKRMSRAVEGDNALAESIKRMSLEALERALSRYQELSPVEADKIHRLALAMKGNPLGKVSKEFWDLDVVRQVMDKEESLE